MTDLVTLPSSLNNQLLHGDGQVIKFYTKQ
jgi:hypothetical protein